MTRTLTLTGVVVLVAAACGGGAQSAGPVTTLPPVSVISPGADPPPPTTTTTAGGGPSTATIAPTTGPTVPAAPTTTGPQVGTRPTKVYFLMEGVGDFRSGPFLVPVHREIPGTLAVATNSILALIAGPTPAEAGATPRITSALDPSITLNGITVNDGLATIDLSANFAGGAGSFAEFARLAQVVYTLTQFPTVDRVDFQLDGTPVTMFGGHGIDVGAPQTRADYEDFLPFIFVDGPSYGGPAGNPLRVTGIASVFEATFEYSLTDGAGRVLEEGFVTGGSGLGYGPFDFTVGYDVDEPQLGSLAVFEISAETGDRINVRDYPVELVPHR